MSAPLHGGGMGDQQQPPASLLFSACAVEIPCQDGVWSPPDALAARWMAAYPGIDVTALLLRMVAWAYSKLEAGGSAFYEAWTTEQAAARATAWLAEEQQKVDQWRTQGAAPEADPRRRGAAGAPDGDWRRQIESLDKLARGKRKRMANLEAKCHFCDDLDNRDRYATQWAEYKGLKAEVEEIEREMAGVKRTSGARKGGGREG